MNYKEKTISTNYIYRGKIVNLRKDLVVLPNNKKAFREIVEHNGGACALAVTVDKKILFVKQYRICYDEFLIELPAGKMELDESPDNTIIRELSEEVGVIVEKLEKAGVMYPTPGYTNEVIHLYYTDKFTIRNNNLDEDEFLEVLQPL